MYPRNTTPLESAGIIIGTFPRVDNLSSATPKPASGFLIIFTRRSALHVVRTLPTVCSVIRSGFTLLASVQYCAISTNGMADSS